MPSKNWQDLHPVQNATSQRDMRYTHTIYDQHASRRFQRGRPWWGTREYVNDLDRKRGAEDGYIGMLNPGDHTDPWNSSWIAPWLPEQVISATPGPGIVFYRIDYKKDRLTWLYQAIIEYDRRMMEDYYSACAKIAAGNGWKAPEQVGDPVSFQITAVLGHPGEDPRIPQAAMAGDPWLLGETEEQNDVLAKMLNMANVWRAQPAPAVTPQQVLHPGTQDIQAMVAEAVAKALQEREDAERAKKERQRENGRKGAKIAAEKRAQASAVLTGAPS